MKKDSVRKGKKPCRASFSVNEFCKRHGLSRSTYYELKKKNLGPREMTLGSRSKRISRLAEKEWIALMESGEQATPAPAIIPLRPVETTKRKKRGHKRE